MNQEEYNEKILKHVFFIEAELLAITNFLLVFMAGQRKVGIDGVFETYMKTFEEISNRMEKDDDRGFDVDDLINTAF
jgi:hypothetical protein